MSASASAPADTDARDAAPATIALSLVSHTNVGKTTLARTLLGRDIGEVRDEAHVTETSDEHPIVETREGDRLVLWDTPGFGDSVRLAKRLESAHEPIGWFLAQVWDRYRDRAFWSTQQAVRTVREHGDVVLYLANAAESPADAGYVAPEMRVLDWIGKPVVVLLNQLGPPRPREADAAEVDEWRAQLSSVRSVRAVLPLDAFARCWVQEATLLATIAPLLPADRSGAFERLVRTWTRRRRGVFDASITAIAELIVRAATDREPLPHRRMLDGVVDAVVARVRRRRVDSTRQAAMRALARRLDAALRATTDRLIALHGLGGHATDAVLARLAEHYTVRERLDEGKAATLGGVVTGALAGLKADLATGGMSFGAGVVVGALAGALGAFGLARGYNLVRAGDAPSVAWTDAALDDLVATALLAYLAVAHYGRGRGDWTSSESPPHWRELVATVLRDRRDTLTRAWSLRGDPPALALELDRALGDAARELLERLYPQAAPAAFAGHDRG